MTQTDMTVEATLSGSAAKLLLHLLRRGRVWGTMAEMMAGAGISKPSYLAAKRELLDKEADLRGFGFLPYPVKEVDHEVKYFGPGGQETLPQVKEVAPIGQETLPDTPRYIAPGSLEMAEALGRVPAEERNFSPVLEKTPRDLCQEADLLPWGGDPKRPTSEFQARRDAQVKAICMAWGSLFPAQNPLTTARAKELLVTADNNAEDIYDALESAVGKDYPFSYAKKILSSKPKPQTSDGRDHTGEMLDWSPEWEAKVRKSEERLRRAGFKFGDDE